MSELTIFILAAGKGKRMQRSLPKVLHPIAGLPLLGHVLAMAQTLADKRNAEIITIASPENEQALKQAFPDIPTVIQHNPQGTGDALRQACAAQQQAQKPLGKQLLILYGDTPFIQAETAEQLLKQAGESIALLGFHAENPTNYGRLILGEGETNVTQIIEAKDLSPEQQSITLCNAGMMAMGAESVPRWLEGLSNDNKSGEYYLTDLVQAACTEGKKVGWVLTDEEEVLGVNSLFELAQAEKIWQQRKRFALLEQGVMMQAPETVFFSHDTQIAADVTLDPHIVFGEAVEIAHGAHIHSFCHIAGAKIGAHAHIGPFARLRLGTMLAEDVRIGNFVEVKNSQLASGVKAGHLSYLGDAVIGSESNIGAGVITCNYDGFAKHQTHIGEQVFIGSNNALIAPVRIGDEALIAAGSTISKDVGADMMAATRVKQQNYEKRGMKTRRAEQTHQKKEG